MTDFDRRLLQHGANLRAADDGRHIEGYALVFNKRSEEMGGFVEVIARGAIQEPLGDVVATFNHDMSNLLGRTESRTLALKIDNTGLHYSIDVPDTQAGRDTLTLVRRGDVSGSSFTFDVLPDGDTWTTDAKGETLRTLKQIKVYEVGPVAFPAYRDTTVLARATEQRARDFAQADRATADRDPGDRDPGRFPEIERRLRLLRNIEEILTPEQLAIYRNGSAMR